jgi:hypothetical protein
MRVSTKCPFKRQIDESFKINHLGMYLPDHDSGDEANSYKIGGAGITHGG